MILNKIKCFTKIILFLQIISQESIECDINSKNTAVSLFSEEKVVKMKRKASPICNSRKFISLAEQIQHFYYDTPDRFKSKPTKNSGKD